MNINHSYISN